LGDLPHAREAIQQAQALARDDDNPISRAERLTVQARLAHIAWDLDKARDLLETALGLHRELSGEKRTAIPLVRLAVIDFDAGRRGEALRELHRLAEDFRSQERPRDEATARLQLAELEMLAGNPEAAGAALRSGMGLLEESQKFAENARLRALSAWVAVASGARPDLADFSRLREELRENGLRHLLLEVEMVRGAIELRRSPAAGREILRQVEQQAHAEGLEIIARRARSLYAAPEPDS
jgi:hypothetical protein